LEYQELCQDANRQIYWQQYNSNNDFSGTLAEPVAPRTPLNILRDCGVSIIGAIGYYGFHLASISADSPGPSRHAELLHSSGWARFPVFHEWAQSCSKGNSIRKGDSPTTEKKCL